MLAWSIWDLIDPANRRCDQQCDLTALENRHV